MAAGRGCGGRLMCRQLDSVHGRRIGLFRRGRAHSRNPVHVGPGFSARPPGQPPALNFGGGVH